MTPKILTCVLVDDEKANLEMLAEYVSQIPFLSLKATFVNPIEALAYLLKTPTDLLITDINMPRLSGIELYKNAFIKASSQSGYNSGWANNSTRIEAQEVNHLGMGTHFRMGQIYNDIFNGGFGVNPFFVVPTR